MFNKRKMFFLSFSAVLVSCILIFISAMNSRQSFAAGKSPKGVEAFKQNKRLGRGVCILGWDPIWRSRDRARMQNKHFTLIKEAGFNSVRIYLFPIRDGNIDKNNKISSSWFETLDWAIEQALSNNLITIVVK